MSAQPATPILAVEDLHLAIRSDRKDLPILPSTAPTPLRALGLLHRDASMPPPQVRKFLQLNHMLRLLGPSMRELTERFDHPRIVDAGCSIDRIVNHGIAFGCYFRDPEDNRIEVYWPTGRDNPQPHGDPIDLTRPESELVEVLENMQPKEGSKPHMYGDDVGKRLPSSN